LMHQLGPTQTLLLLPPLGITALLVWTPLSLAITSLVKRLLIGRYRPARVPIWGSLYLRDWIVCSVARLIPWWLLEGTVLTSAALRALGACIGRRVHIQRGV